MGGALNLMLPFETTKPKQTDRQTNSQEYYRIVVHRPRGARLGMPLSAPQCWESTALPHTHTPRYHRDAPFQPVLEVNPSLNT